MTQQVAFQMIAQANEALLAEMGKTQKAEREMVEKTEQLFHQSIGDIALLETRIVMAESRGREKEMSGEAVLKALQDLEAQSEESWEREWKELQTQVKDFQEAMKEKKDALHKRIQGIENENSAISARVSALSTKTDAIEIAQNLNGEEIGKRCDHVERRIEEVNDHCFAVHHTQVESLIKLCEKFNKHTHHFNNPWHSSLFTSSGPSHLAPLPTPAKRNEGPKPQPIDRPLPVAKVNHEGQAGLQADDRIEFLEKEKGALSAQLYELDAKTLVLEARQKESGAAFNKRIDAVCERIDEVNQGYLENDRSLTASLDKLFASFNQHTHTFQVYYKKRNNFNPVTSKGSNA